jgi:hypothetical protein
MIHDITHCTGNECKLKNNCYRYVAWKEVDGNDILISVFINPPFNKEENECKYYMKNEEKIQ